MTRVDSHLSPYLYGFALIAGGVTAYNWPKGGEGWNNGVDHHLWLVFILLMVPLLAAWFGATLMDRWRPRKIFRDELRRGGRAFALGLIGGILTFASVGFGVHYLRGIPDEAAMAACALVCTVLTLLFTARVRDPGLCVRCDYDLRGSIHMGRCPECGLAFAPPPGVQADLLPPTMLPVGGTGLEPLHESA